MKKIALNFYGCRNLGDDLFVYIFSRYFSGCKIKLFCHPSYFPKGVGKNVKILSYSYWKIIGNGIKRRIFRNNKIVTRMVDKFFEYWREVIYKTNDAYVRIGGSLYKECNEDKIDFSTSLSPDFTIKSRLSNRNNSFVIGANLGPVCTQDYWERMKEEFGKCNHVCLRDYASYLKVQELANVQYAPDVIFMLPKPKTVNGGENVVFSIIDISRHTTDTAIVEAYYELLVKTITHFAEKDIQVTLMSFCKFEGDEKAINYLMSLLPENDKIKTFFYNKDMQQALEVIAQASYVVGTRFHSVILAMVYDKPVFPIVYNCKTENYLRDLSFEGKYAKISQLDQVSYEDVVYNYHNKIVTDCSLHKQFAKNQFWGLQNYLDYDSETIEL